MSSFENSSLIPPIFLFCFCMHAHVLGGGDSVGNCVDASVCISVISLYISIQFCFGAKLQYNTVILY